MYIQDTLVTKMGPIRNTLNGSIANYRRTLIGFTQFVASCCFVITILQAPSSHAAPGEEPAGFHGMLVVGSKEIYISHLPMFIDQHRYQGIWQVTFGEDADARYRNQKNLEENAEKIFTLAPKELFRLPELIGEKKSFLADVFIGHFEQPGNQLLIENATVSVINVLHWHPFLGEHLRPDNLTYILFGNQEERFIAHWISRPPSFDQILSIDSPDIVGGKNGVIIITDPPERGHLKPGEENVAFKLVARRSSLEPPSVTEGFLTINSQNYFEAGELGFSALPDIPMDTND